MTSLLFELKDIHFSRVHATSQKPFLLFQGINLSLAAGDITVVMGVSGSGKSTLLRLLNRLEEPDSGTILFKGKKITEYPVTELRRRVGMLFQLPALPESTIRNNLQYGPRLRGESLSDLEMNDLLSWVGLERESLDRNPNTLSVGQQQRVSLARTLANKPEVLLLDEPTSSLDRESTLKIEETIKNLVHEKGLQVIWVTHDHAQADRLAGNRIHIHEGKIQ